MEEKTKKVHKKQSSDSFFPSYTLLTVPYRVICRQRYHKAGTVQRVQFMKELRIMEAMQSRALDGVRLHREFCNPILSYPIADNSLELTPEERRRLEDILASIGSNPLTIWDKTVKNGHIRRVVDDEIKSLVLEISGTNVSTTYIICPTASRKVNSLGIKLPFLVMVVKNMKRYFTFEIQILDDKNMRRRFRVSNFQSTTKVLPFCTTMPIGLSPGWNQIQFNLADFTRRAYGSTYLETVKVQVHANVRIRRIYFADKLYSDEEMPPEFRLFLPGVAKKKGEARKSLVKEEEKAKEIRKASGGAEVVDAPPVTPVEEEILLEASPTAGMEIEEQKRISISEPATKASTEQLVEEVPAQGPGEEIAPSGEESAAPTEPLPAEEQPGEEETAAKEEEAPAGEEVTPTEGEEVAALEEPPGKEEEATPAEEEVPAVPQEEVPAEEASAPEEVPAVEDAPPE